MHKPPSLGGSKPLSYTVGCDFTFTDNRIFIIFSDIPHFVRRDIFAFAKVILRLRRSDILFASSTAARQYHSAESRISLRSNRTRRKANRTEKSTCNSKCFFLGGSGWTRASLGVRLLRKPPIYRLVVLIHPFLHKNNQPQKRLEYLVIYLTTFGVIYLLLQK